VLRIKQGLELAGLSYKLWVHIADSGIADKVLVWGFFFELYRPSTLRRSESGLHIRTGLVYTERIRGLGGYWCQEVRGLLFR
jgi:hypothetical protein